MADSTITIAGNLTRDPELRFTQGGRAVANFAVAVGRRYQVNGEWREDTSYFDVIAWGSLGENAAASLNKGNRVIVTGRLEQRRYEDRDGNKRTAVEIVAEEMGPSMRWARATLERVTREGGQGADASGGTERGGGYTGGDRGAGAGGGSTGGSTRQPDPVYGDEEPF